MLTLIEGLAIAVGVVVVLVALGWMVLNIVANAARILNFGCGSLILFYGVVALIIGVENSDSIGVALGLLLVPSGAAWVWFLAIKAEPGD